jgi:hypothetical protein
VTTKRGRKPVSRFGFLQQQKLESRSLNDSGQVRHG